MSNIKIVSAMPRIPGMTKSEIDKFLTSGRSLLRLGTVDKKGDPQIHPVWYYSAEDMLYLITDKRTRKLRNIERRSTVYFSIDTDSTPNRGVKGKGTAQIVKDAEKAALIVEKIVAKYLGDTTTGLAKGLLDAARNGSEIVVEITLIYYSVWDYGKMAL